MRAIRRTNGGLKDESLVTLHLRFKQNHSGWVALEFLAWWVRDLSRSGELVQMRAVALPPKAFGTQLGRTLQCVIELFAVASGGDRGPVLEKIGKLADSLTDNLNDYEKEIANPTQAEFKDIESLKRGAENDDASAQYDLGMCYANGDGVKENLERAFDWFLRAAKLGHPDAMLQVGLRYDGGDGVDKDYARAFKWYTKASEAGVPLAFCCVVGAYQEGKGVEKDLAKAAEWYRRGADLDNAPSQAELGSCYEHGSGVKKDLAEALRWYEAALENGLTDVEPAIARVKKAMR